VYQDGINVAVDGYCWTKRLPRLAHYTPEERLQVVCIITSGDTGGPKMNVDTLLSIGYDKIVFASIGNPLSAKDIKSIVAAGSSYTCIMDNAVSEEQLFDNIVNNLKLEHGQWATLVTDQEPYVSGELLLAFKNQIDSGKNFVTILDDKRSVVNICAYRDLGGQYGIPFVDKLKEFENWEEQCITVRKSQ
jgi:hypothetical protein